MPENDSIKSFYLLKEAVTKKYFSNKGTGPKSLPYWSVEDIKNFQDDLVDTLGERLSERWFYTHLKPVENEKLPRIDMLNILSKYVGFSNWEDFKTKHAAELEIDRHENQKGLRWVWIAAMLAILAVGGSLVFMMQNTEPVKHRFCFVDADSRKPIDVPVEMVVTTTNESPKTEVSGADGCLTWLSGEEAVHFVVKAPYYKTDTIERTLPVEGLDEVFELRRDDYALMIQYFATADVLDWEKRRNQLDGMISDEAVIFQISENNLGMEMYNKTDFIDKLTTPLRSLGKIEIVETVYEKDKIINLRFMQL